MNNVYNSKRIEVGQFVSTFDFWFLKVEQSRASIGIGVNSSYARWGP